MSDFDRLRPRRPQPEAAGATERPADSEGRRALYSSEPVPSPPATGSVTLECSSCGETSVLTPAQALRAALPSVHLPLLKRDHSSWMRCPACQRRTWVRAGITL